MYFWSLILVSYSVRFKYESDTLTQTRNSTINNERVYLNKSHALKNLLVMGS
jgi:hypothetical protein